MVDKYIRRDATTGEYVETPGTVSGGTVGQAGNIPALDNSGRIDPTLMPVGVVADTYSGTAFENIQNGAFVYIRSDGQVANATGVPGGIEAMAFALVGVSTGQSVLVYFEGRNTSLGSLTPGKRYYLSDSVPGGLTGVPIVGADKIHQYLGRAVTSNTLSFEPGESIILAA